MKVGSDSNLWYYWNQTDPTCEENEVRHRINNKEWDVSREEAPFRHTSILCFATCSLLTCVFLRRLPSSAPGASASTSPPSAPSMSCRSAADWPTNVDSPSSGATGASPCCGDPTTAQLRQVKHPLPFMETMKGVKMRKTLPFRSASGQHVLVVLALVFLRSTDPHPDGRYVVAP